jgi:hypothetical protein
MRPLAARETMASGHVVTEDKFCFKLNKLEQV